MELPCLILDTNVLVSALRSSLGASYRLISLIDLGVYSIGLTVPLVLDYESVCKRLNANETVFSPEEIGEIIDYICQVGRKCTVHFRTRPNLPDVDDDMILEASIATSSTVIVTHNVRDFHPGGEEYGIIAMTPREALKYLGVIS